MRKIIVLSFITLDGVIQAPGGPEEDTSGGFKYGGWIVPYFDELLGKVMGEQMSKPFELLLGRKTFEIFASYWPQHSERWPGINEATKYVASNTLTEHEWQNTVFLIGLMSLAQLARLVIRPEVLVAGYRMPLWPSALAFVVLGGLSIWLWKLTRTSNN